MDLMLPLVISTLLAALLAGWFGGVGARWLYTHTGRSILSFISGEFLFLALFCLFWAFGTGIAIGIVEEVSGHDTAVAFILLGGLVFGIFLIPFMAFLVFAGTGFVLWRLVSIKQRLGRISKARGLKLVLLSIPAVFSALLTFLFLFTLTA